jgi:predicted dehydrogenase
MAKTSSAPRVFDTDRRIRLGIWGLGRGLNFFKTCRFLNLDVVAGCDFNAHMRDNFLKHCPGAFVTDNAEEFLRQDFDAVLLATFCPAHAEHAIACLRAGKHVLSEVTSFFTLAEGVRLVEEVEKRKLVYNLAENYPFSAPNMWLASRWREGLFGELMYAEYEYVHECRMLAYTYIDGIPVQPGHTVHNWRSWFSFHYYCTHSLGPAMVITGTRPVAVEAFPATPRIAGYLRGKGADNGIMTPSLVQMSNGGVVRNLMGASTNDSHHQRIWGTRGSFEIGHDGVRLRLGGAGQSPMLKVAPHWEGLGELAAQTGHGGGDFWTLYYFAREILTGEKGPFDIYGGCDVTIPGIQALRSAREGGKPMEVPDFRNPADRERYRNDDWQQERYDTQRGVFGGAALNEHAARFSTIMKDMTIYAPRVRAYLDWKKVQTALVQPAEFAPIARQLLLQYPQVAETFRAARAIVESYPNSDGAQVLREMLELGEENRVLDPAFLPALKKEVASLNRKYGAGADTGLTAFSATSLQPAQGPIQKVAYPRVFPSARPLPFEAVAKFHDIRGIYANRKQLRGVVYARAFHTAAKAGKGRLCVAADGPFKVFVNRKELGCNPKATNPIHANPLYLTPAWRKGKNEVLIALDVNGGMAWGLSAEAE